MLNTLLEGIGNSHTSHTPIIVIHISNNLYTITNNILQLSLRVASSS